MANGVIVYKTGGATLVPPGRVVTKGEGANFDTVTERWFYDNGIPAVAGTKDGNMYCIGASDIEWLPGGCALATITYRGLLGAAPESVIRTKGVRETNYAAISGIPNTSGSVQGRVIDEVDGSGALGLTTNFRTDAPSTTDPVSGQVKQPTGIGGTAARIYTYPFGWICTSFSAEELLPGIWGVSEEWIYYHRVIFD